jgi:hypothetical protein
MDVAWQGAQDFTVVFKGPGWSCGRTCLLVVVVLLPLETFWETAIMLLSDQRPSCTVQRDEIINDWQRAPPLVPHFPPSVSQLLLLALSAALGYSCNLPLKDEG